MRGYHYLRNPVIWHDEAALLINVADKSFAEHLGPLHFAEAAPPLFLWLEKAFSLTLGESTFALRLLPFLASCAALLGLGWLAWRVLSPWAAVCFAMLFACSDRLLWHACEAKPYAVDVFVSALMLVLFVKGERHSLRRNCLLYAALSPILVFLSFPACFVLGGLALTLLPGVWQQKRASTFFSFGLFTLVLAGSFLVLLLGPIAAQRVEHLEQGWRTFFPHWDRPWLVPGEMLYRLTEVCRYACEPVGNLLAVLAVVGGVVLWRAGQRRLLAALVCPLLLACVAWLAGKYPMGPTRVMAFAAPALLLLAAAGCPPAWTWLRQRHRLAPAALALLLVVPLAQAGYRVVAPWERADTESALALVRKQLRPGEIVIGTSWEHGWYCRDLGEQFRTLVAWPHDPPFPATIKDGEPSGETCWLMLRSNLVKRNREPATHEEAEALRKLGMGTQWTIAQEHQFRHVTVFQLRRASGSR